jgi:AcrR family transcriptional regulator
MARPVGRPARLSQEQIVAAALEVGIADLTMATVADRLATSHQALYRWVRNRDELVALVADAYVQRLDVTPTAGEDWRTWLWRFADSLRRTVLDNLPGFAAEGLTTFRTTLPFLRLNQTALGVLIGAGFTPADAQRIYQTVGTALLGWLAREDAYRALRADPEPLRQAVDATVRTAQDAGDDLGLVRDTAVDELTAPTEDRYRFLVDVLLAGLPDPDPDPGPVTENRS